MKNMAPRGLFITGTDTDVGKTYVASLIARELVSAGHHVGVYKPAASGCRYEGNMLVSEDALSLWNAAKRPGELERVCPQRYTAPLAPHLAARAEGRELDHQLLRQGLDYWRERSDVILVEGSGGLMCPVSDDEFIADLAADFGYPLLIVARNALGTINHTLQTLMAATAFGDDGLKVAGIVLNHPSPAGNDPSCATNRAELAARCVPPILAEVSWQSTQFDTAVNWWELAE